MSVLCILGVLLAAASAEIEIVTLNGDNWLLSDSSGRVKGLAATVPGQVHTEL